MDRIVRSERRGECVGVFTDGNYVGTASTNGAVRVWRVPTRHLVFEQTPISQASTIAFSPDSGHVASNGRDSPIVRVWDIATNRLWRRLNVVTPPVLFFHRGNSVFHPNVRIFLIVGAPTRLVPWRTQTLADQAVCMSPRI